MAPSKPTPKKKKKKKKATLSATRQPPVVRYGNVVRVNVAGRRPALAWAALGVVYVVWGSTYLGHPCSSETCRRCFAAGVRFLVGGSLLWLAVLAFAGPGGFRMTWRQFGTAALVGVLLPAWGNGLVVSPSSTWRPGSRRC